MDSSAICPLAERSLSERNISVTSSIRTAVLATLQANAERKPKVQFKQDTIGKLIDIQAKLNRGQGHRL